MIVYLQMINAPEDKHKFEVLYHEYRGLMFYIANKILSNEQDAEDVVHTAFVTIAENIQKIDEPVCPKTKGYVVIIVESKAIDLYRRKRRHPEIAFREEFVEQTISFEGSHAVTQCFARLPAQAKHILLLKYQYGYDNREIAKMLNISESNAIKRIQRAKERLEELCREEELL